MIVTQPRRCAQCPLGPHGFLLVVDDDEDARYVVRSNLLRSGYAVAGAANGREALDAATARPAPCAILLDLNMPVMDGFEFLAARAGDDALRRLPVAVMSGALDCRAQVLDVVSFLQKPFEPEQLLRAVAHCCDARRRQ
jgi:CheY-like chemotaxis protein